MGNGVEALFKVKEGDMHTAAEAAGKGRDARQDHDLAMGASVGHETGLALADDATLLDELSELVYERVERRLSRHSTSPILPTHQYSIFLACFLSLENATTSCPYLITPFLSSLLPSPSTGLPVDGVGGLRFQTSETGKPPLSSAFPLEDPPARPATTHPPQAHSTHKHRHLQDDRGHVILVIVFFLCRRCLGPSFAKAWLPSR